MTDVINSTSIHHPEEVAAHSFRLAVGAYFDVIRTGTTPSGKDRTLRSIRHQLNNWRANHISTARFIIQPINATTIRCMRLA